MKRLALSVLLVLFSVSACHSLTLEQLRFRTSEKLGQDTTLTHKVWSNAALNVWINDAIAYISEVALCYSRDTTFALELRKTDYAMPSDFIKADAIIMGSKGSTIALDRSPVGLTPTNPADLGKNPTVSVVPQQWQDRGQSIRKIKFTPRPQIVDSVTVTYFAYAPSLSGDTNSCALPLAFQLLVPQCAAADAWSNRRQDNPYWQEFLDRLGTLVPSIQKKIEAESATSKAGQNPTP